MGEEPGLCFPCSDAVFIAYLLAGRERGSHRFQSRGDDFRVFKSRSAGTSVTARVHLERACSAQSHWIKLVK